MFRAAPLLENICWGGRASMSPLCELISPLFHSVFDNWFTCSRWRCLTGFEGVVKLMFIISANQLNMFRDGNALPASIPCRFMGSFKFSQVAATSYSVTMETKRGRRCCGRVTCFKGLWRFGVEKKHALLWGVSMFSGMYLKTVCVCFWAIRVPNVPDIIVRPLHIQTHNSSRINCRFHLLRLVGGEGLGLDISALPLL